MQAGLLVVAALAVVGAPSARDQAKALYAEGKQLCLTGDADGCLAKRIEGHKLFPNAKVIKAIVARFDEVGDTAGAVSFLEETVAGGKPANGMVWSKKALDKRKKVLAAKEAEAAAAAAASATPAPTAPAVAAVPVPAPAPPAPSAASPPTEAKAEAPPASKPEAAPKAEVKPEPPPEAKPTKGRQLTKRQAETVRRKREHERKQAKLEAQAVEEREAEKTRWLVLGWSSAAVAVGAAAGGIILALNAQSEHDSATACQGNLDTFGGTCPESEFQSHRDAQSTATTTAFLAAGAGAVAAAAATTFLYWSTQVGEPTAAPATPFSIIAGPGGAWLSGRF